jgi:sulfofructose kinase
MATSIICVGNATLDRIWTVPHLPLPGQKMRSLNYLEVGGGQAANAAVAAARLGGDVSLICAIGSDMIGTAILDQLRAEHIDLSSVHFVSAARSISAAILVDTSGERAIIGDVDPRLHAKTPKLDVSGVARAQAVLTDVKWPAAAEQVLAEARRRGVATVLDIEPAAAGNHERLVPFADHAIFGQAGLSAFAATDDPERGLAIAYDRLRVTVGVTLGAAGVRILTCDGRSLSIPAPKVQVVDTTGAGDAFHGAYALAIGEGQDIGSAATFASAVAALKCTMSGGRAGLPTRSEVARFMRGV